MKKDYTDITIVLDRSGSMISSVCETIDGFNSFLKDQKKVSGEATITLVQFDDQYEVVYEAKELQKAEEFTGDSYTPRGMTALLDAIGRTIESTGERLEKLEEQDRPNKVIFVIITDGLENYSKKFTRDKIFEMIRHQESKYNWQFVFIGANQDAIEEGANLGISAQACLTYLSTGKGTKSLYDSLSIATRSYRNGDSSTMCFTDEDREKQT